MTLFRAREKKHSHYIKNRGAVNPVYQAINILKRHRDLLRSRVAALRAALAGAGRAPARGGLLIAVVVAVRGILINVELSHSSRRRQ